MNKILGVDFIEMAVACSVLQHNLKIEMPHQIHVALEGKVKYNEILEKIL